MTMSVTQVYITVMAADGCPKKLPFWATLDSVTGNYSLGSTPFINGAPVSSTNPLPTQAEADPPTLTQAPLDVTTVVTAGTAVTVLNAGHRNAGGLLQTGNAAGFYVNEIGTAGTTVAGGSIFVQQNQPYAPAPTAGAVSVNATASGVVISGWGLI